MVQFMHAPCLGQQIGALPKIMTRSTRNSLRKMEAHAHLAHSRFQIRKRNALFSMDYLPPCPDSPFPQFKAVSKSSNIFFTVRIVVNGAHSTPSPHELVQKDDQVNSAMDLVQRDGRCLNFTSFEEGRYARRRKPEVI